MKPTSANVGSAAESLVVARLLMLGLDVARPLADNGIDFLVYAASDAERRFVPVQVKSASSDRITLERRWFAPGPDLILVFAWLSSETCFVFDGLADFELLLGRSALTPTWRDKGTWANTSVGPAWRERLKPFDGAWHKVSDRFRRSD